MSRLDIEDRNTRIDVDKLNPCGDQLLVMVLERSQRDSGIILPGKEKSECCYCKVIRVGCGITDENGITHKPDIKPGDYILIMDYAGDRVNLIGGKKFRFIREQGVWAKIEVDASRPSLPVTKCLPYNDKILVQMARDEKTLSGRLFIPDNPQTKFRVATVLAVGPGHIHPRTGAHIKPSATVGSKVITMRYSGAKLEVAGAQLQIQQDMDLQAEFTDADVDIMKSGVNAVAAIDDGITDEAIEQYNQSIGRS